jgi:hypothetical protein
MTPSADGRGRTLLEILTGRNKKDMTPLELQYHNPLKAKIGVSMSFKNTLIAPMKVNFFVQAIEVWETLIDRKKYYHTDYCLKGQTLDDPKPMRYRLRLTPDEDASTGYQFRLMKDYYQCGWTEAESMNLLDGVLRDQDGEFHINEADDGTPLDEPLIFWREGDPREARDAEGHLIGDPLDPYSAKVTILKDLDGDGTVEDDELERLNVSYWDYSRLTHDEDLDRQVMEFLSVQMDEETRVFTFLRGEVVEPFQVEVI